MLLLCEIGYFVGDELGPARGRNRANMPGTSRADANTAPFRKGHRRAWSMPNAKGEKMTLAVIQDQQEVRFHDSSLFLSPSLSLSLSPTSCLSLSLSLSLSYLSFGETFTDPLLRARERCTVVGSFATVCTRRKWRSCSGTHPQM